MSMSDCVKCWDTPCTCGYDYREWSKKRRVKLASVVLGIDIKIVKALGSAIPEKYPKLE